MAYNFSARFINKWDLTVLLQCREGGKNEDLFHWSYSWKALMSLQCFYADEGMRITTTAQSLRKCPGGFRQVF